MKKSLLIAWLACVAGAGAQEPAALQTELSAVSEELHSVIRAARAAPQTKALGAAVEAARTQLEQAEQATPGVAAVDAQLAALREQMRALQRQRRALLDANSEVLSARRAALEEAESAYVAACRGGQRGETLLRRRHELLRQLDQAGVRVALPPQ